MADLLTPLESIRDIKQMMERSSRFISLSGLSGIAAGICALTGAWLAHNTLTSFSGQIPDMSIKDKPVLFQATGPFVYTTELFTRLLGIAFLTFLAAFLLAFLFTYLRSKKTGIPIWGHSSRRVLVNIMVPMLSGGAFLIKILFLGSFTLLAPGCLLFYGLALVNASKFTLPEIRYLGFVMILLALVNLLLESDGLLFWALGFGVSHILYGSFMWLKYERGKS